MQSEDNIRYRMARRVSAVSATANALLSIAKILIGYWSRSHALVADGLHSLSDLLSDALVVLATKIGSRQPDSGHPYGHRRFETLAAILIAIILLGVGGGIIYDAILNFLKPSQSSILSTPVILTALFSMLVNEGLYRYMLYTGEKVNSELLITNAWHNRSDALGSLIVLISAVGSLFGWSYFDLVGAILIALLIIHIAFKMLWRNTDELIDAAADKTTLEKIRERIQAVPGVRSIHQLRTRSHSGAIFIDVHVLVDPFISVSEGHYISDQVHLNLLAMKGVVDVTVHIDPENDEEHMRSSTLPNRATLEKKLTAVWSTLDTPASLEKIILHYLNDKVTVEVFLSLPPALFSDAKTVQHIQTVYAKIPPGFDSISVIETYFLMEKT